MLHLEKNNLSGCVKKVGSYRCASYFDLHLEIDTKGKLNTKLYVKRDDFNFPIVNFPFLNSNIPSAPAYGVYVPQVMSMR